MKETMFVSFSGGRTSAYMCWYLIENWSHKYEFIFIFANTGQEDDKTLDFVGKCDRKFKLNLVWLEANVIQEKGAGTGFNIVDYASACRDGSVFEDVIKKYGIPNPSWPHCNRELKITPIEVYMQSLGFKRSHQRAIGIRIDEADRMDVKSIGTGRIIYPLITLKPTTKGEIRHWWLKRDFDLDVPEHDGNCKVCWKKSDRKLFTIAKHRPERFDFIKSMESKYSKVSPIEGEIRKAFRGNRTTNEIIASSLNSFVEFKDYIPEWQLDLRFDIDKLDIESSCGSSCEAF